MRREEERLAAHWAEKEHVLKQMHKIADEAHVQKVMVYISMHQQIPGVCSLPFYFHILQI